MELNKKFFQAAALLAVLLPAAAMLSWCQGSSTDVQEQPAETVKAVVTLKPLRGDIQYEYVAVYSKDAVGTKNDLVCVYNNYNGTRSCNWDKANGLVPAAP